ncbi:esterase/lipase family protein [Archangium lansingense]|uniref:Alpha/beta fold hydrolase n=1 Tax=Archangium lansingense TaxID=2995310 RepID=A0ABT4AEI6_9BACT|nr:alpha/beta fold hydrolase [Archangium lansinium]MCY1080084.1 alpha/beta fold hydrolase [Archangium lansinium]
MEKKRLSSAVRFLSVLVVGFAAASASAQCRDAVVLVHGNTASPSDYNNTYNTLISRGYASADIFRPSWGSKTCAACNDHSGSEETPVRDAINQALTRSCTGKIDVIGHSMGVTLAIKAILDLGAQSKVEAFGRRLPRPVDLRHLPLQRGHLHLRRLGPVRQQPLPHRHLRQAHGHPHLHPQEQLG